MKSHRTTVSAAGVALFVLGASLTAMPSGAASVAMSVQEKFRTLDTDHDGFLSRGEAQKLRDYIRAFTEADQNRDGKLDAGEFVKAEAIYEREQAATYVDDTVITTKVKAALLREAKLKSLNVSVETYKGHVLLSGFVNDPKLRDKAIQVASGVQGVVKVKDGLALK